MSKVVGFLDFKPSEPIGAEGTPRGMKSADSLFPLFADLDELHLRSGFEATCRVWLERLLTFGNALVKITFLS